MLTYFCVIFGKYPYDNAVVPFCKEVDVDPSIVQPNADNLSDVKAFEYNMLYVATKKFKKFPLIIKLLKFYSRYFLFLRYIFTESQRISKAFVIPH